MYPAGREISPLPVLGALGSSELKEVSAAEGLKLSPWGVDNRVGVTGSAPNFPTPELPTPEGTVPLAGPVAPGVF